MINQRKQLYTKKIGMQMNKMNEINTVELMRLSY